nr:cobalamin B12-binding domain-containing protein [Bradyrhizobium liaoningense]
MRKNKTFRLVLIKPSHYDDEGYVIRWWRGGLPSNSLACLYGIALDCRERGVLGPDCDIEIDAIDETNWKVRVADLARAIKAAEVGMVMLVGVQSNQFPRSLDLARQFRKLGIHVAIGGFHVSGTLSMLPERDAGVQEMMDLGVSVFAGEAEGRLEELLQDAVAGRLRPLYNYIEDLPHLESHLCRSFPASRSDGSSATPRASMRGAAARSSARSAPLSTCRGASRDAAAPTTSRP